MLCFQEVAGVGVVMVVMIVLYDNRLCIDQDNGF
jgi:hypothetical protein